VRSAVNTVNAQRRHTASYLQHPQPHLYYSLRVVLALGGTAADNKVRVADDFHLSQRARGSPTA
jgi:hypothetical protein